MTDHYRSHGVIVLIMSVNIMQSAPSSNELDQREVQYFEKALENNIQKMFTNYRLLLKKNTQLLDINKEMIGSHEEIQVESASRNIVSYLWFNSLFFTNNRIMLLSAFKCRANPEPNT